MVTHPSPNQAQCKLTMLIKTNLSPISKQCHCRHYNSVNPDMPNSVPTNSNISHPPQWHPRHRLACQQLISLQQEYFSSNAHCTLSLSLQQEYFSSNAHCTLSLSNRETNSVHHKDQNWLVEAVKCLLVIHLNQWYSTCNNSPPTIVIN